ncbi:MAG: hypothetical protein RR839_00390 [Oscillospiraceae bacterium]
MEMIKIYTKSIAILLLIVILMTACTKTNNEKPQKSEIIVEQQQSDIAISESSPKVPTQLIFGEIEYKRPNILKSVDDMDAYNKRIMNAASSDEAFEYYVKANDTILAIDSMLEIAFARYCTDCNNRFYKVEMTYWINNLYYLDKTKFELSKAVDYSAHSAKIYEQLDYNAKQRLNDYKFLPHENRDWTINYYTDMLSIFAENSKENSDYAKAKKAFYNDEVFEVPTEDISKKMITAVKLKNDGAKSLSFNDYNDMIYSQKNYSKKEIEMLLNYVKEIIVPIFKGRSPQQFSYKPVANGEELSKRLLTSAKTLSPVYMQMLTDCETYQTLYLHQKENTQYLPCKRYISTLSLPFILLNIDNSQGEINDFAFAIGESLMEYSKNSPPSNLDKYAYISCGNVAKMMFERFYDLIYLEGANEARQKNKYEMLQNFLLSALTEEYSQYIFVENNLTIEKAKGKFNNLYNKYYGEKNNNSQKESCYYLVANMLILKSDTISDQLLAEEISMEISQIADTDLALAQTRINSLLLIDNSDNLKRSLTSIGLSNPFNYNSIKKLGYFYESIEETSCVSAVEAEEETSSSSSSKVTEETSKKAKVDTENISEAKVEQSSKEKTSD